MNARLSDAPLPPTHRRARRPWRALLGVLLWSALCAGRCEEPSWWVTDKAIVPICERVLACGGWGYVDSGECQDGLVGNPALGTPCKDRTAYFECVHDCCWDGCRASLSRDDCDACQPPDCNLCDHLSCETFASCEDQCREGKCAPP